jgi:DNA polymerase III subunit epsilon
MTGPHWSQGHLIAFDIESTGVDVFNDRVVTAAIVHAKPGERPRTLSWVVDPGVPVPVEAAAVHGWTNEKIAAHRDRRGGALQPEQALFEIAGQVALAFTTRTPLVAFNAAYDLSLLEAECVRHGVPTVTERLGGKPLVGVVDPFVLDKHYSRRKGSRKLVDQCGHYKVILAGAHDACADALATLRLIGRMVATYPELRKLPLTKLHDLQVGWRAEQMDSLRAYFDRMGKEHDGCDGAWPLRTAPASVLEGGVLL